MKSAPNGYTPTVPSLHRDREIKRHERTKLRFYTEFSSLEVVLIGDCLTAFSPAPGEGEPQRLKPNSKQSTYRSGKPLRHPKTTATSTFSASCKAACVAGSDGMAKQAAEKAAVRRPAPKGASDFEELTVSLKRYPDTNLSFSAACEAVPFPKPTGEGRSKAKHDKPLMGLHFQFNAWAKYDNYKLDARLGSRMAKAAGARIVHPTSGDERVVLEGGSIDVNGRGTLLTSEE